MIKVENLSMLFSTEEVQTKAFMGHRTKRILRIERKEYQTY